MEPSSTPAPSRRVLLVGINDYTAAARQRPADSPAYPVPGDLAGPRNDVAAMAEVLTARFGFAPSEVCCLLDGEATRQGILDAIEQHLVAPCQPGDEVVFYFSGHGTWVHNSKSKEQRKVDEALVPADFAAGAWGIRDKELRRLFRPVLDRGGRLTLVFDSCYAGGLTRGGKARFVSGSDFDVCDGEDAGEPLDKAGALALVAAKDFQVAIESAPDGGLIHGNFTRALLTALGQARDGESAREIFLRTRAILRTNASPQEPDLAAPRTRRDAPLFGFGPSGSGATRVAIRRVDPDGNVVLQGGWATGLAVGAELEIPAEGERSARRMRIESVSGPCQANARFLDSEPFKAANAESEAILPGTLAEVRGWSFDHEPALQVWWSEAGGSEEALLASLTAFRTAWEAGGGRWSSDPQDERPDLYVYWDQGQWVRLRSSQEVDPLGARLEVATLRALVRQDQESPLLFVDCPIPAPEFAGSALSQEATRANVVRTARPEEAHYQLQGRRGPGGLEYRWVRSDVLVGRANFPHSMPQRSRWVPLGKNRVGESSPAAVLSSHADRLARVRAILTLPAPPYDGFPYRLVVRDATRNRQLRSRSAEQTLDRVQAGARLGLALERLEPEPGRARLAAANHYVYVFALDHSGKSTLLFPFPEDGLQPNAVGANLTESAAGAPTIVLGQDRSFEITGPFGLDTYFLLATLEPLPDPLVLEFDGVRDGAQADRSGLASLLSRWAAPRRSVQRLPTSATWSLERLELLSEPATEER